MVCDGGDESAVQQPATPMNGFGMQDRGEDERAQAQRGFGQRQAASFTPHPIQEGNHFGAGAAAAGVSGGRGGAPGHAPPAGPGAPPVKRGRGRPRKYIPAPNGTDQNEFNMGQYVLQEVRW